MSRNVDRYFADNKAFVGLQRSSLRSGVTYVIARGLNVFVQLASTVVLARLLGPHDFGLVAIVLALVGFAPMLIDLGTTEASIQKTRISEVEISSLFWLNIAIGLLLTLLLAGGSGVIARMFDEPSLTGIALALSATFIMSALSTQHYALMRRAMQFRRIAIIDISANAVGSVVSVVMALTGFGYWALVAKPLVTSTLAVAGVWTACRWVPGRPLVTPDVRELVRFGLGVTGFTMTDYLSRAGDRIAIGYVYGPGPLGYFQNAFTIYSNLLSILTEPLHSIAVSGLSKLRNDLDQFKRAWATALSSLSFFSAPAFAVLAVTGQDLVVLLLGPKWAPAGPLLCIFALRGIAHGVERSLGWVHVAAGRSDRWMRWGLVSALVQLAALIAGLPFGVIGVATTYAVVMFGLFIPALVYAGRPVGIGYDDVLRAVGPPTIAALAGVAVGFGIQQIFLTDYIQLVRPLLSGAICLAVYFAVVVGIFKVTGPLRLGLSLLREYAARRSLANS
ncbi:MULTISPECIES: lipopolysaccharide biosynthesis protein [Rhodopseudomonas]|uniref:Polysaccharide biosynthesis protein n=1 Tax=Rhodopseudomonas palustris TaxID=1076 RepID=A0A0D7F3H9_RHOPL|nr:MULTISPECIES: lipopolysaccharide biosynthesis protein [Rhodopseudomonas]KIZ47614.1 polysaccharide biosynthesis protein [Rhodopseudomonas palustris]MDF3808875.1 lipopolysaccharide biosynthesis protein [Rhodopseudomonas sp. BAL398]WOK15842.1 lipopolysaccharide biosynthesis protein [Rhodopseudomonas sp. BAL398]